MNISTYPKVLVHVTDFSKTLKVCCGRSIFLLLLALLIFSAGCADDELTGTVAPTVAVAVEPTVGQTPSTPTTNAPETPTVQLVLPDEGVGNETIAAPPTPTATEPPATPTMMPMPEGVALFMEDGHISTDSWSLDSRWLAVWVSTAADLADLPAYTAPAGTLHLVDSEAGETCALPQFRRESLRQVTLVWQENGRLLIQDWEANAQWLGEPCLPDSFEQLADAPVEEVADAGEDGVSPNGRFQASTTLEAESDDNWRTYRTVLQAVDGGEITAVTWRTQATVDEGELGGEWISPTHLYIPLADGGDLLLDAEQPQQVTNVLFDLFALTPPQPGRGTVAIPSDEPDGYTLILFSGPAAVASIALYHAASGQIEELPYTLAPTPVTSPDGEWLLMYGEANSVWTRQVSDIGGEWQLLAENVNNNMLWRESGHEVALSRFDRVTWLAFPEGELIGEWLTAPYEPRAVGWSPNGRILTVIGGGESWVSPLLFLFE